MTEEVRRLFHELAGLSPGERERILAQQQVEPALQAEVESLLGFDSPDAASLTDCVSGAAEDVLRSAAGAEPTSCGPYRLVRLLGSGGMGAVYLAERTDGELQQQVAVKLLRADGHRAAWRDRFIKERQLLASLHHPSIVHVIDAGHTEDGRPFLVMEYVEGEPIDAYVENLDLRSKLGLFLKICEAVSYAHRNLIIHRDLKPSNILVDASGRPKLLDFGIAKILDAAQDQTQTGERLLTPEYASPEQIRGTVQTTATDIYSLGAVLYKLLTGSSPHASGKETREEMIAAILTKEPAPPSRLNPGLPRDLDFILAKALRKEPEERYPSVDVLADDLSAFLEWRPVRARSGNAWYRTRRFLRRYWVPVVAAALVMTSLAGGLYIANRERANAERRFQQVRQLANIFVFDVEDRIKYLPGATQARKSIVDTALTYLESLRQDAGGDASLLIELASAYEKIGDVQGFSIQSNLGDTDGALASYGRAQSILEDLVRRRNAAARQPLASIYFKLGMVRTERSAKAALEDFARARNICDRLVEEFPKDPKILHRAGSVYAQTTSVFYALRGPQATMETAVSAMNIATRLMALDPSDREFRDALAGANSGMARARTLAGQLEAAAAGYRAAVEIHQQLVTEEPQNVSYRRDLKNHYLNLGDILGLQTGPNLGDTAGAAEAFRNALKMSQELQQADPSDHHALFDVASVGTRLGSILVDDRRTAAQGLGQLEETERMSQQLLATDAKNARYRYFIAYVDRMMGEGLITLGREREAARRLERAAAAAERLLSGPNPPGARRVMILANARLAAVEARAGNPKALHLADAVTREIAKPPKVFETPWIEAAAYRDLADVYRRTSRRREAAAWLERSRQCLRGLKAPPALEPKRQRELARVEADLAALNRR